MKTKTKHNKVPKSAKTRLSDLAPKKDARGGGPEPTPPGVGKGGRIAASDRRPALGSFSKKHVTL
jgi:hypothetical protein